jgi:hypothetical protein
MNMYENIKCMILHGFFLLGMLYNAIMNKQGIGRAYCIYLLKRIPMKFVCYFYEFSTNLHGFCKLG